jgi:predicted transporter
MSNFGWYIVGNMSGAVVMTAIWIIIGVYAQKKEKKEKGDKQ